MCIDAQSTGAVRVSFGIASNFQGARRFLEFARSLLDRTPAEMVPASG